MRKLGKQITQKGTGKRKRKSANELIAELTTDKKVKRSTLANQLGVSDRTLRSYKKYFASLDNPKIKLGKNDRVPPKKVLDKLSKIATKKKIRKTREVGSKYDKSEIYDIKDLINDRTYKRLQVQMKDKNWFGWLIRVNLLLIGKEGTFNQWFTFLTKIKTKAGLNNFLRGELEKLLNSRQNLYQVQNILGFEILEIAINSTLKMTDK